MGKAELLTFVVHEKRVTGEECVSQMESVMGL